MSTCVICFPLSSYSYCFGSPWNRHPNTQLSPLLGIVVLIIQTRSGFSTTDIIIRANVSCRPPNGFCRVVHVHFKAPSSRETRPVRSRCRSRFGKRRPFVETVLECADGPSKSGHQAGEGARARVERGILRAGACEINQRIAHPTIAQLPRLPVIRASKGD